MRRTNLIAGLLVFLAACSPDAPPTAVADPTAVVAHGPSLDVNDGSEVALSVSHWATNQVYEWAPTAAVWVTSASGSRTGTYHFYWYVQVCYESNYCGGDFTEYDNGVGLDSINITLEPEARALRTYVVAREPGEPNYRDGVSSLKLTRGPAWGAEGGPYASTPCFTPGYPFRRYVGLGAYIDYRRNYCTGLRENA